VQAFDDVARTLDLIESLQPAIVVPGHGAPFDDVAQALAVARHRLDGFVSSPDRHRLYAAKVLLKFKLLELQEVHMEALQTWAQGTPYLSGLVAQQWPDATAKEGVAHLLRELVRSGAAQVRGALVLNAG
jgi:hypothetical protein